MGRNKLLEEVFKENNASLKANINLLNPLTSVALWVVDTKCKEKKMLVFKFVAFVLETCIRLKKVV